MKDPRTESVFDRLKPAFFRDARRRARERADRCPDCGGALVKAEGAADRCPICGWTRAMKPSSRRNKY